MKKYFAKTIFSGIAAVMLFVTGCAPKISEEAQTAISAIEAVGAVTENSGGAIEKARKAYDALSGEDKDQVSNIGDLKEAEKKYEKIEEQIKAQEEIDACIKEIDEIGKADDVTLEAREK